MSGRGLRGLTGRVVLFMVAAAVVASALTVAFSAALSNRAAVNDRLDALEQRATDAELLLELRDAPARDELRLFTLGPAGGLQQPLERRRTRARQRARAEQSAAVLAARPPGRGEIEVDGRDQLYVRRDTELGPIAVVRPRGRLPGDASPRLGVLVIAGGIGALVAALLALALARRLLRPVGELEQATAALASGRSDARAPVRGNDELADLARSFNSMADDLDRARESERRFLHAVSHELRTPLTAVAGYADAISDGQVDPGEAAPVIRAEAAQLERLVGDLLELASIGASGFAVASSQVDLVAVAEAVRERFSLSAREAQVALVVDAEAGAAALGDAGRLTQAVANLVENALRATPARGTVTIEVTQASIAVSDSGPGLEPDALARVFEPFPRRRPGGLDGGSGLGLPIVRELVAAMGGSTAAEPAPAGGLRIVLSLRVWAPSR